MLSLSRTTCSSRKTAGWYGCARLKASNCRLKAAARSAARRISGGVAVALLLAAHSDHEQRGVAHDRGEDIVKVVRDPAGDVADHFHFLRVQELRLGFFKNVRRLPMMAAFLLETTRRLLQERRSVARRVLRAWNGIRAISRSRAGVA